MIAGQETLNSILKPKKGRTKERKRKEKSQNLEPHSSTYKRVCMLILKNTTRVETHLTWASIVLRNAIHDIP